MAEGCGIYGKIYITDITNFNTSYNNYGPEIMVLEVGGNGMCDSYDDGMRVEDINEIYIEGREEDEENLDLLDFLKEIDGKKVIGYSSETNENGCNLLDILETTCYRDDMCSKRCFVKLEDGSSREILIRGFIEDN